jgi:hypothetical protein
MKRFFVTFETVTPESAEHGDAESRGYAMPGGWHFDESDGAELSLSEAIGMLSCAEDCGAWWQETDGRIDYKTGAETRYSLHPPRNITAASYRRITRLLRA